MDVAVASPIQDRTVEAVKDNLWSSKRDADSSQLLITLLSHQLTHLHNR